MIKSRLTAFIIVLAMLQALMCFMASADTQPVFEIGQITSQGGTSVKVPITLSDNNVGICGATLTVTYDSELTLTDVEKGEALSSLNMTKPGDMKANPVNILWDGIEADTSNGVIAFLIFTAPVADGSYPIRLSYVDGDIFGGSDVLPVDAIVKDGAVTTTGGSGEQVNPSEPTGTTMMLGNVSVTAGKTVTVPISILANTGICGATITVEYDKKLTLTGVEQGEALSSLNMTKPGKMTENPVNIVWDGMEEDASDGVIAYLTFTVPDDEGTYPITLSYAEGDILDGDVEPIDVKMVSGAITVGDSKKVTVTASGKSVTLENNTENEGKIILAYYGNGKKLLNIEKLEPVDLIEVTNLSGDANEIKVMWWKDTSSLKPLSDSKVISLK